jgi:Ser/Thr protein kinase RdoA (MazF antagonist)
MFFYAPSGMLAPVYTKGGSLMDTPAFFTTLVSDLYEIDAATLPEVSEFSDEASSVVFRLARPDGVSWLLRLYRSDHPLHAVCAACGAQDVADWVDSRAATLFCLARQGYPAPQVIRTRRGELIGQQAGWCTLLTTFCIGTVLKPTLEQLRLLGAALGHLHRLPEKEMITSTPPVGKSFWYPELAIPQALERLALAEPQMLAEWGPLFEACRQTLQRMQQWKDHLPTTIIHGDAWPANAIQTAPDQVVLVDWETGGLGLAVLDLCKLLLEGHLDSDLPPAEALAWHIHPDPERIHAIVDGYCQQRVLTPAELDLLLEGVRFNTAFIGAIHFAHVVQHGSDASLERRYARLQNRYAVSDEVAAIARLRIEQVQGS